MFRLRSKRILLLLVSVCCGAPFETIAFSALACCERVPHAREERLGHGECRLSNRRVMELQAQQESNDSDYYELERYRNRSALLESTLRIKLQEITEKQEQLLLVKSKVQILEDVTKRLRGQQQEKDEKMKKEQQEERQRLEEKLSVETLRVKELDKQLHDARADLDMQTKEHQGILEKVQLEMNAERKSFEKQARIYKKQEEEIQEKMGALKNELLNLDETLEISQDEMKRLRRAFAAKEDEIRHVTKSERQKRRLIKEQLAIAQKERDGALQQLNETAGVSSIVDEEKEQERLESIQIAEAAVLAAEKREIKLQQQLKDVQTQYDSIGIEKEQLQSDLIALKNDLRVMESRVQSMEVSAASKGSLEKQLQDVEKENRVLRGETERLIVSLRSERLANASNRKVDQQKFDELIEAERMNYEQQLRRLQSNTSQPNVAEPTESKQENRSEDRKSSRSGVWKRLRSPRSWFPRRR